MEGEIRLLQFGRTDIETRLSHQIIHTEKLIEEKHRMEELVVKLQKAEIANMMNADARKRKQIEINLEKDTNCKQ